MEIVVAEVGGQPDGDQIYRITFDGSVTDEPGFVAFGGQADQVSAALKEHYSEGMSLSEAFAAALAALSAPGNGERTEFAASQLEVAILERARDHRTFRRIRAARLEELIAEARSAAAAAPEAPADSLADSATRSRRLWPARPTRLPAAAPAALPSAPGQPPSFRTGPRAAAALRPRHRPGRRPTPRSRPSPY